MKGCDVCMKTYNFQEQIENIREEAIKIGYKPTTISKYMSIWRTFIKWKKENNFIYNQDEYSTFLLEHYKFDIITYTHNSKSRDQQLMRSKKILDDFNTYKNFIKKRVVPNNQKDSISEEFKDIIDIYKKYCCNERYNSINTINIKEKYITNILSYMQTIGLTKITDLNENVILNFITKGSECGNRSKSRYFYILRDFLIYLYDNNILNYNYSSLIPSCRSKGREKIPTYIKVDKIKEVLENIPKTRKIEKRDYAIILMAAELGIRISDILNLKLDDIDWKNKEINFIQQKTQERVNLPISNELGWTLIDYIKNARPISSCRNVFLKHSEPYRELIKFNSFNKYFFKEDNDALNNKKGIHNLRHSLATRMLDNEIPLPIISETLGHSSVETTKIYLKVDEKRLKECSLEVDL